MKRNGFAVAMWAVLLVMGAEGTTRAAELRIAVMQAQAGDARRYQPLVDYLAGKGIRASLVTAQDYPAAAAMFDTGKVDAMFSGSGVAGVFLIKELADPLVRPQPRDSVSTYAAVVIAPKGSPAFTGAAGYFDDKRVVFTPLASAGEFYFRSLGPSKPKSVLKAASHGAALESLVARQADVAIVKNLTWAKEKGRYPELAKVGGDDGQNPEGTLIVSRKVAAADARNLAAVLLGVGADGSPAAKAVKDSINCTGFIATTLADFEHTLSLLRKSGVTKSFNFSF